MSIIASIQQALKDFQEAHRRDPSVVRVPRSQFLEFAQLSPVDMDSIFGDGASELVNKKGIESLCTAGLIGGVPIELDYRATEIVVR